MVDKIIGTTLSHDVIRLSVLFFDQTIDSFLVSESFFFNDSVEKYVGNTH